MSVYHTNDCGKTRVYKFRYIRSSKIGFSVKARGDVAICLASDDDNGSKNIYEIFIGCWGGSKSGIRRGKVDDVTKVNTPNILSASEFRFFWIKIKRGVIKVGKRGEKYPFMTFDDPDKIKDIKFYGYCTGWGAQGDWVFNDEKDSSSSSSDSEFEIVDQVGARPILYKRPARWVPSSGGHIPRHAVSVGEGRGSKKVYVGMAKHNGGHIVGMVARGENVCHIPFGGNSIAKIEYYILSNPGKVELIWISESSGRVPSGAIEGGPSESNETLYIGRVYVNGVFSCGKVHPSHGVCYVTGEGREHSHRHYEVLCARTLPCRVRT